MNGPSGSAGAARPTSGWGVFVSSILKELEAERRAARAAIERLGLAPVMLELRPRPHPPRQLDRAQEGGPEGFGEFWGSTQRIRCLKAIGGLPLGCGTRL